MEFKTLNMEVKANEDRNTFEGYASKYGNVDLHGDIIMDGAFTKTINERHNNGKKGIKVLYQHQEPIGIPEVLESDSTGLFVRGKLAPIPRSKEVIELMKMGVVDGMSIGYDVVKDEFDDKHGIRYLKELKLFEVSIVTWGANPEAMVTDVKHMNMMRNMFDVKSLTEINEKLDRLNDAMGDDLIQIKSGKLVVNMDELKEGRVLSRKNSDSLRQAMELIQSVLASTETEKNKPESNTKNTKDGKIEEEDDTEFKSLLDEIRAFAKGS